MLKFLNKQRNEEAGECSSSTPVPKKTKFEMEKCPHGVKCYRQNPHHFREYDHPHLTKLLGKQKIDFPEDYPQEESVYQSQLEILKLLHMKENEKEDISVLPENCTMSEKLKYNSKYSLFFTNIPMSPATMRQSNSITFPELLCPSLGALKESLQINFMIDIAWLIEQYRSRGLGNKPLTIIYGDDWPDMKEFIDKFLPNVKYHLMKMKDPFGCHHSKVGIYVYEDNSVRVVVSTANLYYEDWNNYNQGLWISPRCPRLPYLNDSREGDSPTGFKSSLINYLTQYDLPILKHWVEYIEMADFSHVQVFLVTSVPGKHYMSSAERGCGSHLHRTADLLSRYCSLPAKTTSTQNEGPLNWTVCAQSSSLGSMGNSPAHWLRSTLLRSLAAHQNSDLASNSNATLHIIYPSVRNVIGGHFGTNSGGCLPYSKITNEKQKWLQEYFHQWKADNLHRSRAMPHIKTYCRLSPCHSKLAWFLLTSANLSKSAWGGNLTKDGSVYVRSYEVGVMFLPKFFHEDFFIISGNSAEENSKCFPIIYDLPLSKYQVSDYPWCN